MKIYNKQNIITNKEIYRILKMSKFKSYEFSLGIIERRLDIFKITNIKIFILALISMRNEGATFKYGYLTSVINIYNLDGNKEDKKLYGIGVLLHELMHVSGVVDEDKCDKYAIDFLNNNSNYIKQILNLKDEWIVEEF